MKRVPTPKVPRVPVRVRLGERVLLLNRNKLGLAHRRSRATMQAKAFIRKLDREEKGRP